MTTAVFSIQEGNPCGFYIQGHTGYATRGSDIVCSAVSSAVILVANQIERLDPNMLGMSQDGLFVLYTRHPQAAPLLNDLKSHLVSLQKQYPQYIRVCNLNLNGGNTNV